MRVILKCPGAADDRIEFWEYIADDNVARADAFIDHHPKQRTGIRRAQPRTIPRAGSPIPTRWSEGPQHGKECPSTV
jgi:hypothetical protein